MNNTAATATNVLDPNLKNEVRFINNRLVLCDSTSYLQNQGKTGAVNVVAEYSSRQTAGTLGGILSGTQPIQMTLADIPSKRVLGNSYSNVNNSLIGGQPPQGDPYQSIAQASSEGASAALDNRNAHRKKILSQVEPQQMISPITGELIADYGTWAEDLANQRNGAVKEDEGPEEPEDPIMAKLKAQLAGRGAKGVIGLGRLFKIMDDDGSNSLSFAEFKKAMRECGMALSDTELVLLFKRFGKTIVFLGSIVCLMSPVSSDRMNTGLISYNDFLNTITVSSFLLPHSAALLILPPLHRDP